MEARRVESLRAIRSRRADSQGSENSAIALEVWRPGHEAVSHEACGRVHRVQQLHGHQLPTATLNLASATLVLAWGLHRSPTAEEGPSNGEPA